MGQNLQAADICLWPLDSCLHHDAATKAANACPREHERWSECFRDARVPAFDAVAVALPLVERDSESRRLD